MFFLGSTGETAGNQICQLLLAEKGKFRLKIRLPDCLLAAGEPKYLLIDEVDFAYDRPALERAVGENVALSWRLHRDKRGWRAFVAFSHPAAERSTLAVQQGPPFALRHSGCPDLHIFRVTACGVYIPYTGGAAIRFPICLGLDLT